MGYGETAQVEVLEMGAFWPAGGYRPRRISAVDA